MPLSSSSVDRRIPETLMIAPDYPAFGHSAVPSRSDFHYTHADFSEGVEALIEKLGVTKSHKLWIGWQECMN